ncbi:HAD family hydrolase [Flavihumibacter solisilvae]|uniref:HAD family hydrolase n=1 Tax=Flavihumibacter solisilvae TaxID=1349421 RepID=A0A0C1L294_9BACT|nr:HAD family hydrolase [Flavihumibacter solisilvae]KIC94112.1 HAD family hydrolase [Flavihumibacter solisilvae]
MNLSTVRLVVTDIDGTLLDSRHKLSNDFYPTFSQLKSKGILFSAASGRQLFNLQKRFEPIVEDVIFISENGSYVVYRNEELLVQAMPAAVTRELLATALGIAGAYPILCGKKKAYVQHTNPEFISNVELYYEKYEVVPDLLQVTDDEFLKIAICDLVGSSVNSYGYFKDREDELQVKISGKIWLDLSHKLANKGRALEVVQQRFGISAEDTMVFGDYLNDLEMMSKAHFSFAVENAHPDIKKAARYRAKSNDENGVVEMLQQMVNLD